MDLNQVNNGRKPRVTYTEDQVAILQASFELDNYPIKTKIEELAGATGHTPVEVNTWFQNRRSAKKRARKELVQPIPEQVVQAAPSYHQNPDPFSYPVSDSLPESIESISNPMFQEYIYQPEMYWSYPYQQPPYLQVQSLQQFGEPIQAIQKINFSMEDYILCNLPPVLENLDCDSIAEELFNL